MYLLDLIGTVAFAIGGAYKAKTRHLNIFGVIFLGTLTAVGGGTFRDVIIGRTPLFYLKDPNYLLACLITGIVTYFLPNFFKKTYSIFRFTDSLGLAAFVVIGVSVTKTQLFPELLQPTLISTLACIFLGMITGFGGGLIRDSVMGDEPYAIKKGSNYVMSAFIGSSLFYFLHFINGSLAVAISFLSTLILREGVSEFGIYKKIFQVKHGTPKRI